MWNKEHVMCFTCRAWELLLATTSTELGGTSPLTSWRRMLRRRFPAHSRGPCPFRPCALRIPAGVTRKCRAHEMNDDGYDGEDVTVVWWETTSHLCAWTSRGTSFVRDITHAWRHVIRILSVWTQELDFFSYHCIPFCFVPQTVWNVYFNDVYQWRMKKIFCFCIMLVLSYMLLPCKKKVLWMLCK